MRMIKKRKFLTLIFVSAITFNACSNAPAKNNQVNAKNDVQQKTESTQQQATETGNSLVQAELDKAKKNGKAVFVVVTGTNVTNKEKALAVARGANEIYKNAIIVEMNRDDATNASLVAEWRLAGAPLPLILVISKMGMPTGGYILEQATAENIAALVPSPKLEQVFEVIGNSKFAIVAFTKKSFADRIEVIAECKKAVSMLNNEAVFIEVDMEDTNEASFMKQLRINPLIAESSISLVINKQGQVAGTSTTVPDANKLVSAAKTPVKGGCGPGCGPAGCGK